MPAKHVKRGLKLWHLMDSRSKYVCTFDAYCGAPHVDDGEAKVKERRRETIEDVVKKLLDGLNGRGHTCMMNNCFTSIELFMDLEHRGIHATRIVHNNRIGLPYVLAQTKTFAKNPQGTLDWRMHKSRKMIVVVWLDKKLILLLSTHMCPLHPHGEVVFVPWQKGAERVTMMNTSPVHL